MNATTGIAEAPKANPTKFVSLDMSGSTFTSTGSTFQACANLTGITLSDKITKIAETSFIRCDNLMSITVAAANPAYTTVDGVLYSKDKTVLYRYPGGRTGSFTIPNGVTTIYDRAFSWSKISSVTIPASIKSFEEWTFMQCNNLTTVTINGTISASNFAGGGNMNLPFFGDLRTKYLAGGPGTYTATSINPQVESSGTWTKK